MSALVISPSRIFADVTALVASSAATIDPSTILDASTESVASLAMEKTTHKKRGGLDHRLDHCCLGSHRHSFGAF
jgi:hypothetical protein